MAARTAVVAGTATAVSGRVARRQANKYDQQADAQSYQAEQAYAQQAPPPPAPVAAAPAPAPDDDVAKLQELAALHGQGVLSDDEFTAAKAKILGI
jgi:hypothetical protein